MNDRSCAFGKLIIIRTRTLLDGIELILTRLCQSNDANLD